MAHVLTRRRICAFSTLCLWAPVALADTGLANRSSMNALDAGESVIGGFSGDGRLVVFQSTAANLVAGDTNNRFDVFVRDRVLGQTVRVSVTSAGAQANGDSYNASISDDGRFIAFASDATNLVPGDTNGRFDAFLHDRQTGETTRVSVSTAGAQSDRDCYAVRVSGNGRFVVFGSQASTLVQGDTNNFIDAFVRDIEQGVLTRVSVSASGAQANNDVYLLAIGPTISGDGRYVVFGTRATTLVPNDTGGWNDAFLHDLQTGETTLLSRTPAGAQGNGDSFSPVISRDGRTVVFASEATNFVPLQGGAEHIFALDRQTGLFEPIDLTPAGAYANGGVGTGYSVSADGRYVAFDSDGDTVLPGVPYGRRHVYRRDRLLGITERASVSGLGAAANLPCQGGGLSADGGSVCFWTYATNLVADDTNNTRDGFVWSPAFHCPGDANGDSIVRFEDLNLLLAHFGQSGANILGDVNGDGVVNFQDLNILLANYGRAC